RRLFLVGFLNDVARADGRGRHGDGLRGSLRLGFLVAEALLCLGLCLALGFLVVAAALFLLALARFGGLSLGVLGRFSFLAPTCGLLGNPPFLGLVNF